MNANFVYLTWNHDHANRSLLFLNDKFGTVRVNTSVGPYKNNYTTFISQKGGVYSWEILIHKGTYFKIGVIKHSEIVNVKRAFSDLKDGYAYYSAGKLRNGSNKDGTDLKKGYGPGDKVKIKLDCRVGQLWFGVNEAPLEVGFENEDLKKGGYTPSVAALMEGSQYSFTLPELED